MDDRQDMVLVVDYHSVNLQFRSLDRVTGEEEVFKKPTCASAIEEVVEAAGKVAEADKLCGSWRARRDGHELRRC